jgi:hypothetical protein
MSTIFSSWQRAAERLIGRIQRPIGQRVASLVCPHRAFDEALV